LGYGPESITFQVPALAAIFLVITTCFVFAYFSYVNRSIRLRAEEQAKEEARKNQMAERELQQERG
jgi:hypothetical protein